MLSIGFLVACVSVSMCGICSSKYVRDKTEMVTTTETTIKKVLGAALGSENCTVLYFGVGVKGPKAIIINWIPGELYICTSNNDTAGLVVSCFRGVLYGYHWLLSFLQPPQNDALRVMTPPEAKKRTVYSPATGTQR